MRSTARKFLGATAAFVSAFAVVLLVAVPAGSAPTSTAAANGVGAPIPWAACNWPHEDLQCARIRVPLDWDHPRGRTIRLAVIRHLASKPDQRIGTAFINPGGPGDTGVGLLKGDPEGVDEIGGGRFDVVSWDPRGTNSSTQVRCFRSPGAEGRFWAGATIPMTKAGSKRAMRRSARLAKRCGKVGGWLLPHISTADTARDLDHLRKLMGEKKLTYIGLSYGTYLGQTYANLFPDRVRAMLLNGLVDAQRYSKSAESRTAMFASSADEVFSRLLSLCDQAGPERCELARHGQSAAKRVNRLFARVRRRPIPAPGASPPRLSRVELSYTGLLFSQFQPLRAPRTWPGDAANLDAALRGDGSALATEGGFFLEPTGWSAASISTAIQCADAGAKSGSRGWLRHIRRLGQKSRLQGLVQGWWLAPCASWPVRGQDTYRGPWNAKTPNPILLINQRYDPSTNYRNAVRADRYLGNAVLLTHEGYGHLAFQNPSACVDEAMVAYLVDLVTPPRGTVCQSNQQPFDPEFE